MAPAATSAMPRQLEPSSLRVATAPQARPLLVEAGSPAIKPRTHRAPTASAELSAEPVHGISTTLPVELRDWTSSNARLASARGRRSQTCGLSLPSSHHPMSVSAEARSVAGSWVRWAPQ